MGREGKGPRGPGPRERERRGAGVKRSEGGARAETVVAVRGARRNVAVRKVFFSRAGRAPEEEREQAERRARGELARVGRARASGGGGPTRPGEFVVARCDWVHRSRARAGERAGPSCLSRSQNSCRVKLTWRTGSSARARPDYGTVGQRPGGGRPGAWVQSVSSADTCTCVCRQPAVGAGRNRCDVVATSRDRSS
jgi:hypothetical protein